MSRTHSKQDSFRLWAARKRQGIKLRELAATVGHDVAVVSKAINHGRYPLVLVKIKEVLGVAR